MSKKHHMVNSEKWLKTDMKKPRNSNQAPVVQQKNGDGARWDEETALCSNRRGVRLDLIEGTSGRQASCMRCQSKGWIWFDKGDSCMSCMSCMQTYPLQRVKNIIRCWKVGVFSETTAHLIKLALFFRGSIYQICLPHPNFRIHGGFRSARFGSGLSFGNPGFLKSMRNPGFWTFRPIFGTVDFWNFNFFPTKFWVGFFSRFLSEFTDLPKAKMAHLRISVFVEPQKKSTPSPRNYWKNILGLGNDCVCMYLPFQKMGHLF